MSQFYETYCSDEKLAPLVLEISWTQNLLIMSRAKTEEARELIKLQNMKKALLKKMFV